MVPPDLNSPEQRARRHNDAMLVAAVWAVQDRKHINPGAAPGVAIREFRTGTGPTDYLLFLEASLNVSSKPNGWVSPWPVSKRRLMHTQQRRQSRCSSRFVRSSTCPDALPA